MRFDPLRAMLVVNVWPNKEMRPEIVSWALSKGIKTIRPYAARDIICGYNKLIAETLLPSSCEHFVFLDKGIEPKDMEPFVQSTADVVGAHYPTVDDACWQEPNAFHHRAWRCHRKVLETVEPPWFMPRYSANGAKLVRCGCLVLLDKALATGFVVARAGKCQKTPGNGEGC
jgi:hypothetical protein